MEEIAEYRRLLMSQYLAEQGEVVVDKPNPPIREVTNDDLRQAFLALHAATSSVDW